MQAIENQTNYKCDHCGKKYFRKCDASRHERFCSQNPVNHHLCFMECKNLERGEEPYTAIKDEIEFSGKRSTFTCKLSGQKLFSYIAERKRLPVVKEPDTIRMPLVCDKYIKKTEQEQWDDLFL